MSEKKAIKIGFPSFVWPSFKDYVENLLKPRFNVNVCDDYDYFFANEGIYWNKQNMAEFLASSEHAIRILLLGECIYPDFNITDYAFCGRDADVVSDRNLFLPYINGLVPSLFDSVGELDLSKKNLSAEQILKEKVKFCNFIYANPNAHPMRDLLFYKISEYKMIDSLGSHLNNVEVRNTRNDTNWSKISVDLKRPYKFSIAAENAKFPGYASEKIVTSMLANTIPIYFGDPKISEKYNPRSFINVSDFSSIEDCVKYIEKIDQNDDLYCEIMSEPWRTSEQIEKFEKDTEKFYDDLYRVFELDIKSAKRRPEGTWPDVMYPNFMIGNKEDLGIKSYLSNWIKRKIMNK